MHKGLGVSKGIAIGKAFVLPNWEWDFSEKTGSITDLAYEIERLYSGIRASREEILKLKEEIAETIGKKESSIFDAHLAILDDPLFVNEVQSMMQREFKSPEIAVKEVIDKILGMFELLDDQYMKERALDIKDVGNRLLKNLMGVPKESTPPNDQPYILVAKELTPSQLAHLDMSCVLGIVTMEGGATSHTSIMARAMGIPSVLGLESDLNREIQTGDLLVIDGDEGLVFVNPDPAIVEKYSLRRIHLQKYAEKLREIADKPAVTLDGKAVELAANISSKKELELALKNGASGVGLFRTEFLYMDRTTLPSEDEQFEVYRMVTERLGKKPLIIRTLDIGGDKQLDYFSLPHEDNPFLGYRAIRVLLDQRDLFKTQLKAILRASAYGNVKIMYPMISTVEEVRKANEILGEAKRELAQAGQTFNPDIEVGIMIEVPSAVAIADFLAREVNFFSIGTNDLIQYTLAVDRMNEHIAHLYDPYHPAVIRMLKMTVDAAKRFGIPVGVCGELAGDILALPIWLGLGVHELSMSAGALLPVKHRIMEILEAECVQILDQILQCTTSDEVKALLLEYEKQKTAGGL